MRNLPRFLFHGHSVLTFYSKTPYDHIEYDENGNLVRFLAQAGGELLMLTGLQVGGPGGALEQSIDDAIAAGGEWLDLTSDGAVTGEDIGVLGQMMQAQGGGGGCGPQDPTCQFQRVVEIAYDWRNQMVEHTDLDNLRTHRSHYDCFGRRVAKAVDPQGGGGVVTRCVYGGQAGWQVLAEYEGFQPGASQPAAATYVYGNYIDEPITMRRDFDLGGEDPVQEFYYHQDDLFNVVAITAGQEDTDVPGAGTFDAGEVVERYRYGDYGTPTIMEADGDPRGASVVLNPFMFTGREWDADTSLYYYRTRYLRPQWGRFTTRDTIGTWGDWINQGNALAYVGNEPITYRDPFGLATGEDTSSLRKSMHARCDAMKPCGSGKKACTKEKCKREADEIVDRYDKTVDKLRRSTSYQECSNVAQKTANDLTPAELDPDTGQSRQKRYSCWKIGLGIDDVGIYTHAYVLLGLVCEYSADGSYKLDPWSWKYFWTENPDYIRPRWSDNPGPPDESHPHNTPKAPFRSKPRCCR